MESSDSADEVREARVQNNIHNAPNDHGVHSGRAAAVLPGCCVPFPRACLGGEG